MPISLSPFQGPADARTEAQAELSPPALLQVYPCPHAALTPSPSPVVSILFLLEDKRQCHHICPAAMGREDRALLPDPLPGLTDARDALDGDLPHTLLEAGQAWVDFADLRLFPLDQLLDDLQGRGGWKGADE